MGDLDEAIATVEDSRQTHVEWIEYLAKYGNDLRPHEEIAGDTAHHREAVEKYDQVLSVLRAALASTEAPEREATTLYGKRRELVPEGWRVEWMVEEPEGPGCGPRRTPYLSEIGSEADATRGPTGLGTGVVVEQ